MTIPNYVISNSNIYRIFKYKNTPLISKYYNDIIAIDYIVDNLWILCKKNIDAEITEDLIKEAYESTPFILFCNKNKTNIIEKFPTILDIHCNRLLEKLWHIINRDINIPINDYFIQCAFIMIVQETPTEMYYLNEAIEIMTSKIEKSDYIVFIERFVPIMNDFFPTMKFEYIMMMVNNLWCFYVQNPNKDISSEVVRNALHKMFCEI